MIHKEGHRILFFLLIGLLGLNVAVHYFLPTQELLQNILIIASIILYLLILQFFRNPSRNTPKHPFHIIAPADGKVVVIEEVFEPEYLKSQCLQISIFMSPFNVHVNRAPIDGLVEYFKYHPGKYLVAWHPKSSTENERTTMVLQSPKGYRVLLRQIAGALARRIVWYAKEGQAFGQGGEYGFIKFGSRVDVYLPLGSKVHVKMGDKTTGGETVIAEINQA